MNLIRTVSLLLCICCLFSFCACDTEGDDPLATSSTTKKPEASTTVATTETPDAPELTEDERKEKERVDFLKTITYLDYEFTGDNEPFFFGRWFEQKRGVDMYHISVTAGSTVHFLIQGAESFDVNFLKITKRETPYFAYSIDGSKPIRQSITDPTVTLPDNGVHAVRIIADGINEHESKWEAGEGFALRSIVPSEGGEIYGIRPKNKVIFFFGDSITEGISALEGELSTADSNSASNSYPWHCAESLGALPYMIAYGGSGIVASGSFSPMYDAIDNLTQDRKVEDGVIPDVIVINHGTNDKRLSATEFEPELERTLQYLRQKYPNAPIVYLLPIHGAQAESIRKIMAEVENGYVVESAGWTITYTDTVHPNAAGAKALGDKLAYALKQIFGNNFFE